MKLFDTYEEAEISLYKYIEFVKEEICEEIKPDDYTTQYILGNGDIVIIREELDHDGDTIGFSFNKEY